MSKQDFSSLSIDEIHKLAVLFAESGLFGDSTAAQCFVRIKAGQELGISPFASMTSIQMANGRPSLSASLMLAMIKNSGKYQIRKLRHNNEICQLEIFELFGQKWDSLGTVSFSMADAKKAELTTGRNAHTWRKYPSQMLFWRCISNVFRQSCPELALGLEIQTLEENDSGGWEDYKTINTVSPLPEPKEPKELKLIDLADATTITDMANAIITATTQPEPKLSKWEQKKLDGIKWAITQGLDEDTAITMADKCSSRREYFEAVNKKIESDKQNLDLPTPEETTKIIIPNTEPEPITPEREPIEPEPELVLSDIPDF